MRGPWWVRHDPHGQGVAERWWEKPPAEGWVKTNPEEPWQTALGVEANGVAWYRRPLPAIKPAWVEREGRLWLRFDAVATECTIWVGGREVGAHVGDFVPFDCDITDAVRASDGKPEIVVRVDQHHAPRPAPGCLVENGHLTKGFHDVLSVQHAGIWDQVRLHKTLDWSIPPGGVWVDANPADGTVNVDVDLRGGASPAELRVRVEDISQQGAYYPEHAGSDRVTLSPGMTRARATLRVPMVQLWSPQSPRLYTLHVEIKRQNTTSADRWSTSDRANLRFGFRDVGTGGPDNRRILINGQPTLIRGVLEWGHEPDHIAPAPTYEECRERFRGLKVRGFNCVCCCMVYMPRHFYEAADEEGMLVWQEHPVWKSPMGPRHNAEYKRMFDAFFRRDAGHPSVVIVSGSCEHEAFDKDLAAWWWSAAAARLPRTLRQVQTAFFAWADPAQTDLYDEHTYDNSGRWVEYVRDVRTAIDALPDPRKPFIMGETIISNAWPSRDAMNAAKAAPAWWRTKGLDACRAVEEWIERTHKPASLRRFRRQARAHALELRKFQSEVLRMDGGNAGWVMNHMRDVPACRCGFIDEMGLWRYSPEELRPFLDDAALLLRTPNELRGFGGGASVPVRVGVSNFGAAPIVAQVRFAVEPGSTHHLHVEAERGCVAWSDEVVLPGTAIQRPTPLVLSAELGESIRNRWRLWWFPRAGAPACARAEASAFTDAETAVPFEEKGYSSGWGLPVRSWTARLPDPASLLSSAPAVRIHAGTATDRVVVSHRLSRDLLAWIASGGRALLFASHAAGGMRAKVSMQWGLLPFVAEMGPFTPGDSDWVVDLLHHDLTRRYQRAVPTKELGLAERVTPLLRYYHTHDSGTPRIFDAIFAARVGAGVLAVSSLDHGEAAGGYLLGRLVSWLGAGAPDVVGALSPDVLAPLTYEAECR